MRRIAQWWTLAIGLLLGLALAGCSFGDISTERAVFTEADAVRLSPPPPAVYGVGPKEEWTFYFQLADLGGPRHILELYGRDDEQPGAPWRVAPFPVLLIDIGGGDYIVSVMRTVGSGATEEAQHGHWVVTLDKGGARLVPIRKVDPALRDSLAAAHGLSIDTRGNGFEERGDGGGRATGTGLSPANLKAFLGALRNEAKKLPPPSSKEPEYQHLAVLKDGIPREIREAALAGFVEEIIAAPLSDFANADSPLVQDTLAWLSKHSEERSGSATYAVAWLHLNGAGLKRDFDAARRLASQAIKQGALRAKNILGFMAYNGLGETADKVRGLAMVKEAAEAGEPRAMLHLSAIAFGGVGRPMDTFEGLAWLERATATFSPDAWAELGRRLVEKDGVPGDLARGLELLNKAANKGNLAAHAKLGRVYAEGRYVPTDEARAGGHFLAAARAGDAWSQLEIGKRLIEGRGITQDRDAGIAWLEKAAIGGIEEAKKELARLGLTGGTGEVEAAPFETTAKSALLIETGNGAVLFEKAADQPFAPASLGKLMTLYVVFEHLKAGQLELSDMLSVSEAVAKASGARMHLKAGEKVSVEALIRAVAIRGANDAALGLAEGIAGSEAAFVARLNKTAGRMGLKDSLFTSATGLPDAAATMTARDVAALAARLLADFPEHARFFAERSFSHAGINYENRNPLLRGFAGADGLMTGQSEAAGHLLVGTAQRDGRRLILVLSGLPGEKARAEEASRLLDQGFGVMSARAPAEPIPAPPDGASQADPLPQATPERPALPAEVTDCGSRRCARTPDGTLIFATSDGTAWYYEDGALGPSEFWPQQR